MKDIKIEKITLNVGAGKDQDKLEKGMKLIEYITGTKPVQTKTNKRIPSWGLRPGLPIGCKLTLRNGDKKALIKRFVEANDNLMKNSQFDDNGNISFGIHEYINIPDLSYNPDIGIMGFQVSITLSRAGFRVARRKLLKKKIPMNHRISKEESIEFMKKEFGVVVE